MDSLDLNIINDDEYPIPKFEDLLKCFELVTTHHDIKSASVNVNIVSNTEIQQINKDFRDKDYPTNIISFEFEKPEGLPDDIVDDFLGDIVIAPAVLEKEALEQNKSLDDHWYHIFIHGLLHLLGYDHIADDEAETMENLEIQLLAKLNIANPYLDIEN
ncbi:rRNA maturation RNase YbeY [Francisellaceae bacterium CB300]